MSTVIKGGTIVTADLSYDADVLVEGGRIVEIGQNLKGDEVLDASGSYVMPGGIVPHTHLEMPFTGTYSADGSLEFWSSGGLAQNVPADEPPRSYESFNLVPKYIWVISVTEDVAVAQYYVEGSYQEVGQAPVEHYLTRATEVYRKEGNEWKVRAAHWSPVAGGSGTKQTAIGG